MAIVEQEFASGPGVSLLFVFDDIAKTITGIRAVNTRGRPIKLIAVLNNIDRSITINTGMNQVISFPPLSYVDGVVRGISTRQIASLNTMGFSDL